MPVVVHTPFVNNDGNHPPKHIRAGAQKAHMKQERQQRWRTEVNKTTKQHDHSRAFHQKTIHMCI
jgi:hypothetical protein